MINGCRVQSVPGVAGNAPGLLTARPQALDQSIMGAVR